MSRSRCEPRAVLGSWLLSGAVMRDDQGETRGIVCVALDITERKRAEKSLRESEERFRSLIESAPEAIFVQNAGRFDYLNPAACKLFGASRPEDLLGKEFVERMAPEYRDAIRERIRLQSETGMSSPLMEQEYLAWTGRGSRSRPLRFPSGIRARTRTMVFIRDITERKRAEESLRERVRNL